jgi:hypothetical protein
VNRSSGIRWICVLFIVGVLSTVVLPAAALSEETVSARVAHLKDLFSQGNALYEAGDFEGAIARYTAVVDGGVTDKDLYYNLANAYYKAGDLGHAVLFYERARRLAPRDRDVRENLALVRSQLRDKQFVREENRITRTIVWLHNNLNARQMVVLASVFYLVLCLACIVFVFRDSARVSGAYRWLSLVSPGRLAGLRKTQDLLLVIVVVSVLFFSTGISGYIKVTRERERTTAVVIEKEVPVFSGPTDETTLQFKVHEGTEIRIREQRKGWVRIGLPGGLSGWVPASTIERV